MTNIRRKLYSRGSSFETTIPMPILFNTNLEKKQDVIFEYDEIQGRWYINVVERGKSPKKKTSKLTVNQELKQELEKNIRELLQEQLENNEK